MMTEVMRKRTMMTEVMRKKTMRTGSIKKSYFQYPEIATKNVKKTCFF